MKGKYNKQKENLFDGRYQIQEENHLKIIEELVRQYGLGDMTITRESLDDNNFSSYIFLTFHYPKDPNVSDTYITSPTPKVIKFIKKNGGKIEDRKPAVRKKSTSIQDVTTIIDKIF